MAQPLEQPLAIPTGAQGTWVPARVPGTRRKRTVQGLECGVIICWILTASSGCFGFYLGFDTKISAASDKPLTCQPTGNLTCGPPGSNDDICNACHRTRFDPVLILISFYQVLLGFVGLLVSCGSQWALDRFGFLRNRFGRGFFLFFIGTLSIAQGLNFTYTMILTLVVGSIDTVVGFLLMISYVCVSTGKVYEGAPGARGGSLGSNSVRGALGDAREDNLAIGSS